MSNEEYSGFDLTMYNLFALLREMYYTRGETETNFLQKSGGVVSGSLTIQGNLVINGQSYTIDTENLKVGDYTITLAKDNEQTLTSMVGMVVPKYDGTNYGFFGWDADGYAYVGDLTNYDGTSAITLANNSSLQRISTIDTTNTVVASNGVIYVYDTTSHCFKKPTNDNKYYVIRNGEFVETELFTEQKSKNIDNALYNLGAFDTISGNTITRQTGYVDLGSLEWSYSASDNQCWTAPYDIPENCEAVASKYIATTKHYNQLVDGELSTHWESWGSAAKIIVKNGSSTEAPTGILQYKLATSYTEQVIENQPLLTLNQDGCNFLCNEWEKGLNLFDKNNLTNGDVNANNGNINETQGFKSTNYITIEPNTNYVNNLQLKSFSSTGLAFYDSNKTYISGIVNKSASYNHFTTPSNAKYVRLTINTGYVEPYDDINNIMLNSGTHPYPYQEYNGAIVREKDIEPVLLWKNSSPTSNQSGGAITTKDASAYKYLVIGKKMTTAGSGVHYEKIKYEATNFFLSVEGHVPSDIYSRALTISSGTSMTLSSGYKNGSADDSACIITEIYGTNVL